MPLYADLVIHHANLLTIDPHRPRASAMAIRRGLIEAVGDDAEILALVGPDTIVHDQLVSSEILAGFASPWRSILW